MQVSETLKWLIIALIIFSVVITVTVVTIATTQHNHTAHKMEMYERCDDNRDWWLEFYGTDQVYQDCKAKVRASH